MKKILRFYYIGRNGREQRYLVLIIKIYNFVQDSAIMNKRFMISYIKIKRIYRPGGMKGNRKEKRVWEKRKRRGLC